MATDTLEVQLATSRKNMLTTLQQKNVLELIENSIPSDKITQFKNEVLTLAFDENLIQCSHKSIINAAFEAYKLSLSINSLGLAYVIPRFNKKKGTQEAVFQVGYKGLIQLIQNTGILKTIIIEPVGAKEFKGYDRFKGEIRLDSLPANERGDIVGYYCFIALQNGFEKSCYMNKHEIITHMDKINPPSWNKETHTWRKMSFDDGALKTTFLQLKKYLPIQINSSIETALRFENTDIEAEKVVPPTTEDVSFVEVKETVEPKVKEKKTTPKSEEDIL